MRCKKRGAGPENGGDHQLNEFAGNENPRFALGQVGATAGFHVRKARLNSAEPLGMGVEAFNEFLPIDLAELNANIGHVARKAANLDRQVAQKPQR